MSVLKLPIKPSTRLRNLFVGRLRHLLPDGWNMEGIYMREQIVAVELRRSDWPETRWALMLSLQPEGRRLLHVRVYGASLEGDHLVTIDDTGHGMELLLRALDRLHRATGGDER